ncbi:MAG TPA: phasin family protein [Rhodanobacteraceae bacterium]|nr:phasin family protein [Rhodanobacteraceae bacterium]
MYSQFQKQSLDLGKQFAEQAYKAQVAALKGISEIQSLQVKALESQAKSNLAFVADSLEVREVQDVTALWPKGIDFARDSAEAAYAAGQEILGVAQKTAEHFGDLTRNGLKAANEAAVAPAKKAR